MSRTYKNLPYAVAYEKVTGEKPKEHRFPTLEPTVIVTGIRRRDNGGKVKEILFDNNDTLPALVRSLLLKELKKTPKDTNAFHVSLPMDNFTSVVYFSENNEPYRINIVVQKLNGGEDWFMAKVFPDLSYWDYAKGLRAQQLTPWSLRQISALSVDIYHWDKPLKVHSYRAKNKQRCADMAAMYNTYGTVDDLDDVWEDEKAHYIY